MNLDQNIYILFILLFPLLGFLVNGSIAWQKARGHGFFGTSFVSLTACLMPLASFALSIWAFVTLKSQNIPALQLPDLLSWIVTENFAVSFGFVIDHLSSLMLLIVTGVGTLIHFYSIGYMKDDEAYARYMAYLNLFLFFMLILVLADSLPLLFVGWEGVGLCSYLLIGFWFTDQEKAKAGKKAFIVNRIGDCGFLIGMFMIVALFIENPVLQFATENANYLSFSFLSTYSNLLTPAVTLITLFLFMGATGKSAQIPLYVWLPDAMAGPTPVSALIHAATMVTAGIYMIARLHFLFVMAPLTLNLIATIGAATAVFAALIAITQYDIKKVLAYSTVSQLGYMFLALGVGAFSSAIFHVLTHAFFKACLFLGAGSVIHSLHHEQDIRNMGGLFKKMPVTAMTFLICTLAISGIPPLSGFFSKDKILYMTFANYKTALYIVGLITAGLTAFYMMRVFMYTFWGETRTHEPDHIHESPKIMTVPLVILSFFAVIAGFFGLPHIFGHSWLGEWLAILAQNTPHELEGFLQEGHLMLISTAVAASCSFAAFYLYKKNLNFTKSFKEKIKLVYDLVYNKFKIDEVYDFLIVKPIHKVSDLVLFKTVDVKIVDGWLVNGWAFASRLAGQSLALLQSGLVGHYVFYLLVGVCLVLTFIVLT